MVDFNIETFGYFTINIPNIYRDKNFKIINSEVTKDKVPHLINHDFYNLGLTREINLNKFSINNLAIFRIKGQSVFNNIPKKSKVSLFTFDYKYITTILSDDSGNYLFEFLFNQDYIVIAEDLDSKYNHSIQVGVRPSETV